MDGVHESSSHINPLGGARASYWFLHAADLAELRSFYVGGLGFVEDFVDDGKCVFLKVSAGSDFSIAIYAGRMSELSSEQHSWLAIDVTDLAAYVRTLEGRGLSCGPIEQVPGGIAIHMTDPEGNKIEFHQPVEKSDV